MRESELFAIKGDRAQWRTVYEHISQMQIGQQITYDELAALLPDAAEGSVRSAFFRAVRECEQSDHRTFCNVRGVGYRMVDADEHERLARSHHTRAKRQLKTAKRKASSADRSRLTREQRSRIDAVELNLSRQMEMTQRLEARVNRLDEDLKAARREQKSDAANLSDRVEQMHRLLVKHGITEMQTT